MSLQPDTFLLCKKLKQSNARQSLNVLSKRLQESGEDISNIYNRFFYELLTKGKYQFLSFVLEYSKIKSSALINENMLKCLNRDDFDLILNLNNYILSINDKCLKSLIEFNPNFFKPVHPYSHFEYRYESYSKEICNNLIAETEEIVETIVSKYKELKILKNLESIISNNVSIKNKPSDFWVSELNSYISLINKKGLFEFPRELSSGYSKIPELIREIIFNLISFRSSLQVLNQLIFQSFFYDNLKIINDENVFKIKHSNKFYIGESMEIFCNWNNFDGFSITPKEIVKLNLKTEHLHYDGIYIVEKCMSQFGGSDGNIINLNLRKISDGLNYLFN